jgi:hypothetical protein
MKTLIESQNLFEIVKFLAKLPNHSLSFLGLSNELQQK